jgi:dCMP deaminase
MRRPTHDEYFLKMLNLVASRATCGRRQVGAIIVSADHQILSTGYNGVPRGLVHCIDQPCPGINDRKGDTSRCEAVHAELNAILQCYRLDLAHTIYISCTPCFACAKMIANTPIKHIVAWKFYPDLNGQLILDRVGITVDIVHRNDDRISSNLVFDNEACQNCGIPRDLHLNEGDLEVTTIHATWGNRNLCKKFVRCNPPRAAYGTLPK